MSNASFDDERDEYQAPGHTAPIMPLAMVPGAGGVGLCEHTFELQSMRRAIDDLRAFNAELRKGKRELRWMVIGLAGIASGLAGILLASMR